MKKTLALFAFCLVSFSIHAQQKKTIKESDIPVKKTSEVNWSAFINTDYVADGYTTKDCNKIPKGQIIQVRFYEAGMRPMDLGVQRPYTISGYKTSENSGILSVKALSDGAVSVIMATGNKDGAFIETINIYNPTSRGYTLVIKGIVEDFKDDKKAD